MKNLKLTLLALTAVFALTFTSCKKQDLQPDVTSDAIVKVSPQVAAFVLKLDVSNVTSTSFDASDFVWNVGGNAIQTAGANDVLTLKLLSGSTVVQTYTSSLTAGGDISFGPKSFTGITAGCYTLEASWLHANGANAIPQIVLDYDICIGVTTPNTCGTTNGITLTGVSSDLNASYVPTGHFQAIFNVVDCEGFGPLKLQGGLTSGSSINWVSPAIGANDGVNSDPLIKNTKSNAIVTWNLTNIPLNYTHTYVVDFNKAVKPGLNYLTGNWSLKSSDGTPYGNSTYTQCLDPLLPGYISDCNLIGYTPRLSVTY